MSDPTTPAADPPTQAAAAPKPPPRPGMSIATPFEVKFSAKDKARELMVTRTYAAAVMIAGLKWVVQKKGVFVPDMPLITGKWDDERRRIVVTENGITERGRKELTDAQIKMVLRAATEALEWEDDAVVNKPPPEARKPPAPPAEIDY